MTFLQELRNSNYCNTRPGIADFVLELMVVCRRLYDLGKHLVNILYSLLCLQPYHPEYTSSSLITEVKQGRAMSVLGWVTA